jgi:hypothetical protein
MRILIAVLLVVCSACSGPSFLVRQDVHIQRLGISLEAGQHAHPLIFNKFDKAIDDFIVRYNSKPGHKFELYKASPSDSSSLRIKLVATRLVTQSQQTGAAFVSLIGLSAPFVMVAAGAPIYIAFWYFPEARSMTEIYLSPDINGHTAPNKNFLLSSPGFLMSAEKQIEKHVIRFDRLLLARVTQIERQVKSIPKVNTLVGD